MASPVISSLSAYVDEHRAPIASTSLLGAKSARIFTHQRGVKGSVALNLLSTAITFNDGDACGFSDTSTSTYTQRVLASGAIRVNMAYCAASLRKYWAGQELEIAPGHESVPYEQEIMNDIVAAVQEVLEVAIWQGDTTSNTANLKRFDGMLKILNADVPSANKETIASGTTKINAVKQILLAMPAKTLKDDAVIFCAPEFLMGYEQELVSANLYHFTPGADVEDITIPGSNVKLVAVPGLAGQNKLVAGRLSNFFYGYDLEGANETIEAGYDKKTSEWYFNMYFNAGVQVAFPGEIILGTIATS